MRVKNDVLSSKARKEQSEKPRRSPRHNDSSDTEDFDMPESAAKPKMTVRTETISETERVDDKRQRYEIIRWTVKSVCNEIMTM